MFCYLWTLHCIYYKSANSLFCIILSNHLPIPGISANIYLVRFCSINVTFGHWWYHAHGLTKFFPFCSAFDVVALILRHFFNFSLSLLIASEIKDIICVHFSTLTEILANQSLSLQTSLCCQCKVDPTNWTWSPLIASTISDTIFLKVTEKVVAIVFREHITSSGKTSKFFFLFLVCFWH